MAQLEEPQWQAERDELSGGLAEVAPWGASLSSGARSSPLDCGSGRKALAPIQEEYAADLEAKKLPGKKILEELRKFGAKK